MIKLIKIPFSNFFNSLNISALSAPVLKIAICPGRDSVRQAKDDPHCLCFGSYGRYSSPRNSVSDWGLLVDQKPHSAKLCGPCLLGLHLSHPRCRNSQSVVVVLCFWCYLPICSSWQCVIFLKTLSNVLPSVLRPRICIIWSEGEGRWHWFLVLNHPD